MTYKSYIDCLNEISSNELYKGLLAHGMFAEKLPPIFSSDDFYNYCKKKKHGFPQYNREYVSVDVMRNISIPRAIGIPNPIAYQRLCETLSRYWTKIRDHFNDKTAGQEYNISRIHLRKMKNNPALFEMNYNNWRTDGTPEPDLILGKKYIVHADVSTCFPSIYTHTVPWALVGKENAKKNKRQSRYWYNVIDRELQCLRNGETHGIMIGPHASNLISEVILVCVDCELCKKWKYTRAIDDYACYVKSYEEANMFLVDLSKELRKYDLMLNHKKPRIDELPVAFTKDWKRQLNTFVLIASYGKVSYKEASSYYELAIKLMRDNDMDAAILNYAIKTLSNQPLTENARVFCAKYAMHLALLYPYLLSLMEPYVFVPYKVDTVRIHEFSEKVWSNAELTNNHEAYCYAIYYSVKYGFELDGFDVNKLLSSDDALLKLFGWLYAKKFKKRGELRLLKSEALRLSKNDMDRNWIFVYEALTTNDLKDEWKEIKKSGVSFLKV